MPELPNPSLIPFVVAVTGHRDLRPQDLDTLRLEVKNIFAGMRERMPKTPLVLLTGLAEGADQLVAEVALKQDVTIVVVLPMPLDIFRAQMTDEAQNKFDTLLALSAVRIMLPLEGRTPEEISASESARAACYETLAHFLALHGQALIALWDGKHSDKRGGTSRVVHYVRSSVAEENTDEEEARCGVVYQVVTPRVSGTEPAHTIRTVTLGCEPRQAGTAKKNESFERRELEKTSFAQVEMNIERFNRESIKVEGKLAGPHAMLIDDTTLPLPPFQKRLQTLYARADAISVQANGWRKIFLKAILCTAVIGTLFYGVHGEMFGESIALWFSFPVFVIIALVLYRAARATHVEAQYLDARAFAEALRVQFFWEMAGIKQPVDRYYLMDQRTELDWIRFALKNVWLLHQGIDEDASAKPNCRVVLQNWVEDQEKWYRDKAERQSHSVHLREKASLYGLIIAVVWSILVPAVFLMLMHGPWTAPASWTMLQPGHWLYETSHVALAVPALLAGAYRLWVEQAGYEEQSREYRYMGRQFAIKTRELEKVLDSPAEAEKLLLDLGIEALKENGRWLLLHRERPLEVLSTP